ncbi:MAG: hypothetical protein FJ087_05665 [Deltaproteobacteria bacterium]|nr:hypothetical protein [Deltaproteobacteria bacterium]
MEIRSALVAVAAFAGALATPGCGGEGIDGPSDAAAEASAPADALPDGPDDATAVLPVDAPAETPADSPAPPPARVDYLVVTADGLTTTANAFAAYRETTGHATKVLAMSDLPDGGPGAADAARVAAIKAAVAGAYAERDPSRPFYVLIVGDAAATGIPAGASVPVEHTTVGWEPGPSDNGFADVDGDHVPDLAVGRIPVRTDAEGATVLEKVKRHESSYEPGPWNRRLVAYAGEGDFGPEQDAAIELAAQKGFEELSYDWDIEFAYDNPDSLYWYSPFPAKVRDMLTEGAVLAVYMGHGGGETPGDVHGMTALHRFPIAAFFACGTGDFTMPFDSDPERLMKQPGALFELVVSSITTHPYGNAVLARELEVALFAERPETFGEAFRRMKWRAMYNDDGFRQLLDSFAVLFMPEWEMADVRRSHVYSYNLLGDPALRVRASPAAVRVEVAPDPAARGGALEVSGTVAGIDGGVAHVTLEVDRLTVPWDLTPVDDPHAPAWQGKVQENWAKAMNKVVAEADLPIAGGAFSGEVAVPANVPPGLCYVKVLAADATRDAIGHAPVVIRK